MKTHIFHLRKYDLRVDLGSLKVTFLSKSQLLLDIFLKSVLTKIWYECSNNKDTNVSFYEGH